MPLGDGSTPGNALAPTTPGSGLTARDTKKLDTDPNERIKALQEGIAKESAASEKIGTDMRSRLEALDKRADSMKPPEFQSLPYAPPKPTTPVEQWGSVAMMAAMLGSMFTRGHATAALDAATAVMNGFKANDKQATDQAYEQWKISNANMVKASEFQRKAYDDAMKGIDRDQRGVIAASAAEQRAATARVNALTASFRDEIMAERIRQEGLKGAAVERDRRLKQDAEIEKLHAQADKQYQDAADRRDLKERYNALQQNPEYIEAGKTGDKLKQISMLADIGHPEAKAKMDLITKQAQAERAQALTTETQRKTEDANDLKERLSDLEGSPEYQSADQAAKDQMRANAGDKAAEKRVEKRISSDSGDLTPEQIPAWRKMFANGEALPPGQFLARKPGYQKAMEGANIDNPGWASRAPTIQAARREVTSGTSGKTLRSIGTAVQHLGTVEELAKKLPNTSDPKAINAFWASVGRQLGYNNVTDFDTAMEIVGPEIVKAIVPNGGGVEERAKAREIFTGKYNREQMESAIKTVKELIRGQGQSTVDQYSFVPDLDRVLNTKALGYFGIKVPKPQRFGEGESKPGEQKTESVSTPDPTKKYQLRGRAIIPRDGKWVFEDTGEPTQ